CHKKEGVKIVIISASPDLVIKPAAEYLEADAYYARSLEVENGIVTGRILSGIMTNIEKDKAVLDYARKNDINLTKSYAYGDSTADIAMFDLVGNGVVVNGRKKLLKIAAKKRKWKILDFKGRTKISAYI
ncbi:MAG: HAD-IB family phosphatase, partial [Pseudoalteromonas sp.]|nr:HAD-IB family phosphatase [Pseudoalteromonas sp.]